MHVEVWAKCGGMDIIQLDFHIIIRDILLWGLHLFAVNLGASARCLEIVHSISTIRHSARLFGTIAPYSA